MQSYVAVKISFRVAREELLKCIFTLLYFVTQVKVLDDNVFAIIKSRCIFLFFCYNMVSFRGKKTPGSRPDWSLLRVNGKFPTSIPPLFIWESSP